MLSLKKNESERLLKIESTTPPEFKTSVFPLQYIYTLFSMFSKSYSCAHGRFTQFSKHLLKVLFAGHVLGVEDTERDRTQSLPSGSSGTESEQTKL